jgi:hypothetical protein
MKMTNHPSINRVLFEDIMTTYRARFFVDALCRFVASLQQPGVTGMQLECAACCVVLPFYAVSVFHKIKFHLIDGLGHEVEDKTVNAIHCHPDQHNIRVVMSTARLGSKAGATARLLRAWLGLGQGFRHVEEGEDDGEVRTRAILVMRMGMKPAGLPTGLVGARSCARMQT